MAIVKMKRLCLVAMRSDQDALLRLLQHMGCVQIGQPDLEEEDPLWERLTRPGDEGLSEARERHKAVERALEVLKRKAPQKEGLLKPKPRLTENELFDEQVAQAAARGVEEINQADHRLSAIQGEKAKLLAQKNVLEPWRPLDLPLEARSTGQVEIQLGTMPLTVSFEEAERAAAQVGELATLTQISTDQEQQYLLLICHVSQKEAVLQVLKEMGWSRANVGEWKGTAQENLARLDGELEKLEQETAALEKKLSDMGPLRDDLRRLADRTAVEISREESRSRLLDTGQTFYLEGWVPADSWPKLEKALEPYFCTWEVADPAEEDYPQVPVQLKNNPLTRPLNMVTEMYSLPAYNGLDPNPLMAPFFVTFFGLMMADMAYGIIMMVGGWFILKKMKAKGTIAHMGGLGLLCGATTFIFGALTGGFLGDFIPQIAKIINPNSTVALPALFTPLDDTIAILVGSLVLGVIQIFTGMAISVVYKIKTGDFIDALFSEITWWIILAGVALAIFDIGTVSGVPVVLVIGLLMLAVGGTRNARGFGKITSFIGLVYNGVSGYFSDTFSYARLMALMLAGSVIAQVFNTLGSVTGNVLGFVVISLLGNTLNLVLNLLGCYVHDLRLQCLEFFGRFYLEGGKPFKPLAIQTKYVDMMKEEQ